MNSVQQGIPTRERSHFDIQKDSRKVFGNSFTSDDALCPGCGTSAIREEGGLVVAFGQSFFHVDCFRCAKCHEKVTADTNLLLLSDGSPVCANCTYCCTICQQAINDEAIMAGEDSFHAHCFKCKICKNRIDELTYARTSHGIYCMDCHNDRVARNRRHAQKKAEMAASGSGGNKPRSIETRKLVQEIEQSHAVRQTGLASSRLHRPVTPNSGVDAKPEFSPHNNDTFSHYDNNLASNTAERGSGRQQLTTSNLSLNAVSRSISSEPGQLGPRIQPITPFAEPIRGGRRRSLDGRVHPLDVRVKRSEDDLVNVGTNGGRTSSPVGVRSDSPDPTIFNDTSTRKYSASSSRLHLDETYTAVLKSQLDHIPNGSFGQKYQEPFDGGMSSPPSHHSSARQSYQMDDNPITLNAGRHKKEVSPPSDLHPQSVSVRSSVTNGRRSPSPASQAYEPHSTENELNVEIEVNVDLISRQAPPLPPKDRRAHDITNNESSDFEPDASTASHDSAVNEVESFPVTQVPHTAYIVPALPPIRFSMNSTDFADLLSSVSVLRSRELPIQTEHTDDDIAQAKDTSPKQTTQRVTTQSYERVAADSMADELETRPFFEGSDDVHRDSDPTFQNTYITEPLIDVPVNFSPPSNQQNMVYPTSITNPDDAAMEPVIDSGDEQGVLYAGDGVETIILHLKNLLRDDDEDRILLDRKLTEAVLRACKVQHDGFVELKDQHNSIKRTNKQYIEGLTIAQAEYERESKARRDAATEITRLKVLVSAQIAKLTALSSDSRRQEQRQKSIKDAHDTLAGLENDLSRLIVQRDIILAEVQDLANTKSSSASPASLIRTLTQSMDNLKIQYQRDLVPLKQERQIIGREMMELKAMRDALLEETAALNTRNEELAILNQEYFRQIDALHLNDAQDSAYVRKSQERGKLQPQQTVNMTLPSVNVSFSNEEKVKGSQKADGDTATPSKKFKWPGYKGRDNTSHTHNNDLAKSKPRLEHNFTQMSILRFTRCDCCGDKMWGSQLRCTFCNMSIHVRCAVNLHVPCAQNMIVTKNDHGVPVSSMFGRDLIEQVTADSTAADYFVPFIVDKCIEAVETLALDYEGIYRKNGGAGQSRLITQLFERGDYAAFDLRDSERFPDICSVTSVLKNYFRSLPVPLLTFDLYEDFISAVQISDPVSQDQTLRQLVRKLPPAHYHTLQRFMLHLRCIHEHSDMNRMNARNLGVILGPTLMKSRNPGAEFSDMAERARSIEWLIGNAPSIFADSENQQ
ncbi:hypothetical protein APHAL10511_000058 [Amanita phalloides]|nr:hypothetical protein APHAL10511_000058 [Amanita phalloides]